jgi:hypothetical protein
MILNTSASHGRIVATTKKSTKTAKKKSAKKKSK